MFKTIQVKVNELEDFIYSKRQQQNNKDNGFVLMAHLVGEVGEAADEIKRLEGVSVKHPDKKALAKELVDVILNVARIARYYDIDIDAYLESRLDEIKLKF